MTNHPNRGKVRVTYGFIHTYGARAGDRRGGHIGHVVELPSKADIADFLAHNGSGREPRHTILKHSNSVARRAIAEYRKTVSLYGESGRRIWSAEDGYCVGEFA